MEIAAEDRRVARFLHTALALISLIWVAICALLYYHAPSFQTEQLYDCRWHLSSLAVSAAFGHLFLQFSQSGLVFSAALVSTLYSSVYSALTLAVYMLDTIVVVMHPHKAGFDHSSYLKLTAIMIVLALFGLGVSAVNAHRLLLIGQNWVTPSDGPASSPIVPAIKKDTRTIFMVTGFQAALAFLSIYAAVVLFPLRLWYVRSYTVQEISCALLAVVTVSGLQICVWRRPQLLNQTLVKAVLLANVCQIVHELNMAVAAFYSLSYISRATPLLAALQQLHSQLRAHGDGPSFRALTDSYEDVHQFDRKLFFRKTVIGLNLGFHIARLGLCVFVVWLIAKRFFSSALWLRVKFKVDTELVNAAEALNQLRNSERKWLYIVTGFASAVAVGHVLLNAVYLASGMLYETMTIATGLSVLFSLALSLSLLVYSGKQLRWSLILAAYFSLNLLVTSSLLLFAFAQDLLYVIQAWQTSAAELDDSPYFLESATGASASDIGWNPVQQNATGSNFTANGNIPTSTVSAPTTLMTITSTESSILANATSAATSFLFGNGGETSISSTQSTSFSGSPPFFDEPTSTSTFATTAFGAAFGSTHQPSDNSPTFQTLSAALSMDQAHTASPASVSTTTLSPLLGAASSIFSQQLVQQQSAEVRLLLYFGDLVLAVSTFVVAICALRFAVHRLIGSRTLQTQPAGVHRMVRVLHWFALAGVVTVGLEFLLLAELQVENQNTNHLSMSNTIYDWFLMAIVTLFIVYASNHERYQALLPVIVLQLASVALTALDLLAQQTEVVQVYVRSALQFYKLTEAILRHGVALAIASRPTASGRMASPVSASKTFSVPMATLNIPMHLLVDVLALHALQIVQWFMTLAMLGISLYCFDNLVEDERDQSNDFHELNDRAPPSSGYSSSSPVSYTPSGSSESNGGNVTVGSNGSSTPKRSPSIQIDGTKIFQPWTPATGNGRGAMSSFDNQLFDGGREHRGQNEDDPRVNHPNLHAY